jgi:hypothetical protein
MLVDAGAAAAGVAAATPPDTTPSWENLHSAPFVQLPSA